jgi:hypothetical protein
VKGLAEPERWEGGCLGHLENGCEQALERAWNVAFQGRRKGSSSPASPVEKRAERNREIYTRHEGGALDESAKARNGGGRRKVRRRTRWPCLHAGQMRRWSRLGVAPTNLGASDFSKQLLRHQSATNLSMINYATPVLAVIVGSLFMGEAFPPRILAGSALVPGSGASELLKEARLWDYADDDRLREMTLSGEEFLRRFLLHVLPDRFVRIRYYGLLANRHREKTLALCREVLPGPAARPKPPKTDWRDRLQSLTGIDPLRCEVCGQKALRLLGELAAARAPRAPP